MGRKATAAAFAEARASTTPRKEAAIVGTRQRKPPGGRRGAITVQGLLNAEGTDAAALAAVKEAARHQLIAGNGNANGIPQKKAIKISFL